ncbi:MAG TPA: hypothetical protein PLX45_21610, partial [Piscinibacter sp.]|nr:hypothetical protein [Piscinibacter sp.]
ARGVEHDEVVARALHLGEGEFHPGRDYRLRRAAGLARPARCFDPKDPSTRARWCKLASRLNSRLRSAAMCNSLIVFRPFALVTFIWASK